MAQEPPKRFAKGRIANVTGFRRLIAAPEAGAYVVDARKPDVARMRAYTDAKNASLYSFPFEGQFARPLEAFLCEFYDAFRY